MGDFVQSIGDGATSGMPELLDAERRAKAEEARQTAPEKEPAKARPAKAETEQKAQEKAAETARDESPTPDEADAGEDRKAAGEEKAEEPSYPEELHGILSKFGAQGTKAEIALARAVRGIQGLSTRTAQENKELAAEIETARAFLSEVAEAGPEGKLVLRPDAAARALAQRRNGNNLERPGVVSADAIRAEVVQEEREALAELVDGNEDDITAALEKPKTKAKIERMVKERVAAAEAKQRDFRANITSANLEILHGHLSRNPDNKELVKELDSFLETFPEELRDYVLPHGMAGGIDRIMRLLRLERDAPAEFKRVYLMGLEAGKKHQEPQDAGSPTGGSRRTRKQGGGDDADFERALKHGMLNPGLGGLEEIAKR